MSWATRIAAGIVVAGSLASGAAMAACTQASLAGKWQIYSFSYEGGSYQGYWNRCTIAINASGAFSAASCKNVAGQSAPMTNGSVTITPSSCNFTGKFTIQGDVNKIVQGTLAADAKTGNGVGTFPGGNFMFSITKL